MSLWGYTGYANAPGDLVCEHCGCFAGDHRTQQSSMSPNEGEECFGLCDGECEGFVFETSPAPLLRK